MEKVKKVVMYALIPFFALSLLLTGCGEKKEDQFTVTFDSMGGSTVESQEVSDGDKASKPSDPIRDGYDFVTWKKDGQTYDFTSEVTENFTLKAEWKEKENGPVGEETYTVTFDSNGGSIVASQSVTKGSKVSKPSNPTRSGYTFVKWEKDGTEFDFSSTVSANITLKAVWSQSGTTKPNTGNSSSNSSSTTKPNTGTSKPNGGSTTTQPTNNDQKNLDAAKAALKSVNIYGANDKLPSKQGSCTVTWTKGLPSTIVRTTSDTTTTLEAKITCGSKTGTTSVKGVIKASTMKYTTEADDNRVTYTVRFTNNGSTVSSGTFGILNGTTLGTISNGSTKVAIAEFQGNKTFAVTIGNTTYVATK